MANLSTQEKLQYQNQGYVIPSFELDQNYVVELRGTLDHLIRENLDVRPEKLVSAHIEGKNDEGVKGSSVFLELAKNENILDLVEDAIGPDIVLWGCHIFCKPGGDGHETPWHQDGHYWPIQPLATCTVWVALDDSNIKNGCLRVIPGSHREKSLHAHMMEDRDDVVLTQSTSPDAFDERSAVNLELKPGQMSMHDVYLIHGAAANTSPNRRTGVALRYMPATSLFDRQLRPAANKSGIPVSFGSRPLWLLRGKDRSGGNDFQIGH